MADAKVNAVQEAVQLYFDGLYNNDVDKLRKAFHPQAELVGIYKGHFAWISLEDFLAPIGKSKSPAERGDAYNNHIVSIDLTGDVAIAKVDDEYAGQRFTDYLTLHKFDEGWRIVHKAYHHYS